MTMVHNPADLTKLFSVGDYVKKTNGDYSFCGSVRAAFQKNSGVWRYVVENDAGLLFIFGGSTLKKTVEQNDGVTETGQVRRPTPRLGHPSAT